MTRAATEGGGAEAAPLVDHVVLRTQFDEFKANTLTSLSAGNIKFQQFENRLTPDYKWLAGLCLTIVGFIISAMLLLQEYPKKTEMITEIVEVSSEAKERLDGQVKRIDSRHKLTIERLDRDIAALRREIAALKKSKRRR